MSDNPFVEAAYAAARRQLREARRAQQDAVLFGMAVYKGGRLGKDARYLRERKDAQRTMHLREALRIRATIKKLRAEIRALERQATKPPHAA